VKRLLLFGLVAVLLVVFTGCAAGPNDLRDTEDEEGEVVGFWRGIWHGFIAPFAFIISLFKDSVGVYEAHNNGGWYNFGYMIGLSIIFGGPSGGAGRARRRKKRD
jgi:hypothetical protein